MFFRNGIKDILITNQVTDLLKIDRLTKIDTKNCNISCCVDNEENIINIQNSAFENNSIINVYIEYDCGANRCGLESFKEIQSLLDLINTMSNIKFEGFQAYNWSIQHIEDFAQRKINVQETCNKIRSLKTRFKDYSPIITGVGTGCFDLEVKENVYDEIQVGSYAFMDAHYSSLKTDSKVNNTINFKNALFVLSNVMSTSVKKQAVVDAGLKSMSLDSGLPTVFNYDLKYINCSDEHGVIEDLDNLLKINDKVFLIPGHCDPTCNLHDWYVVKKDNIVIDLWPVSARGFSY